MRRLIPILIVAASMPARHLRVGFLLRERYLITIAGCNDCHTPNYPQSGGKTPEKEWLTGDALGWRGPWGTTYAPNLRLSIPR